MVMKKFIVFIFAAILLSCSIKPEPDYRVKIDDHLRAQQIKDLKFGMFICWSFSTFSGMEWTPTLDKDASYFRATSVDTDQWARVAKEAGMLMLQHSCRLDAISGVKNNISLIKEPVID